MINFQPQKLAAPGFTKPFHIWSIKFISKNLWRFHNSLDSEDLFQEVLIVFLRVSQRYPGVEQKHLMSLFQRSVTNLFNRLSTKYAPSDACSEELLSALEDRSQEEVLHLVTTLADIPHEVKELLRELLSDGSELLKQGRLSNKVARTFFGLPRTSRPVTALRQVLRNGYNPPDPRRKAAGAIHYPTRSSTMKMFQQLTEAADYAPKQTDNDQAVLTGLAEAVNELPDAEYEKLPKAAQTWYNKAVEAIEDEKDIAVPAGFVDWRAEKGGKPKATAGADKGDDKGAATGAKKSAAQKKREDDAKKAKADKGKKDDITGERKGRGAIKAALSFVFKKGTSVSVTDIIAFVESKGLSISPSTAKGAQRRVKTIVEGLLERGWPTEDQAKKMVGK